MMIDGKKLRAIRRRLDLTQTDFGRLIGYRKEHISRMENGEVPVPMVAQVLVRVLSVDRKALSLAALWNGVELGDEAPDDAEPDLSVPV